MQALLKYLPVSLENELKIQYEKFLLNRSHLYVCNESSLLSVSEINFKQIFNQEQILEYKKIEQDLDKYKLPDGTGGVNIGDRKALFFLIRHFKPRHILEIGTHIGASTLHIALALSQEAYKDFHLTSVDLLDVNNEETKPWLKYDSAFSPRQMIADFNLEKHVDFINCSSIAFLSDCNQKFDFIFLDGSHSADVVYQEVPLALNLLKKDGVILLHDYFPDMKPLWSNKKVIPGPYLAIKKLQSEGANLKVLPLGKLPWSTKYNSNITSLALLTKS